MSCLHVPAPLSHPAVSLPLLCSLFVSISLYVVAGSSLVLVLVKTEYRIQPSLFVRALLNCLFERDPKYCCLCSSCHACPFMSLRLFVFFLSLVTGPSRPTIKGNQGGTNLNTGSHK